MSLNNSSLPHYSNRFITSLLAAVMLLYCAAATGQEQDEDTLHDDFTVEMRDSNNNVICKEEVLCDTITQITYRNHILTAGFHCLPSILESLPLFLACPEPMGIQIRI